MKTKIVNSLLCALLLVGIFGLIGARTLINLVQDVTGILPIANGGTNTASPALVAGTNVTITGAWPNQTINATNSAGGASIANGPAYGNVYCISSLTGCVSRSNVVANNLIIAICSYFTNGAGAGTPSFSDTLGLSWHQIATVFQAGNSRGVTAWWANPGATTGATTFSCGNTVTMTFGGMTASEVSGATVASPIDTSATNTGNATFNNISLTTASDGDLLFFGTEYGGTGTYDVWWTVIGADTGQAYYASFRKIGAAGTYQAQSVQSGNYAALAFAVR